MKLIVIGCGDFQSGKSSSYFMEDDYHQYLVDCGDSTFRDIKDKIKDGKSLYVFITYLHNDHAGSLASLIMWYYFVRQRKLSLVLPLVQEKYVTEMRQYLQLSGCDELWYDIISDGELNNCAGEIMFANYQKTSHQNNYMSFGIIFMTHELKQFFISGDATEISPHVLKIIHDDKFSFLIQDTSFTKNSVHISLDEIEKIIPKGLSHKCFQTHYNHNVPILPSSRFRYLKEGDILFV